MGRATRVEHDRILLEKGTIPTSPDTIHIDCSASAISNLDMKPVFQGTLITPQTVRSYQPVFSAAFIAHCEAAYGDDDAKKNQLCSVVPLPNSDIDYLRLTAAFMLNQYNWSRDPEIRNWLLANRLDGFSKMVAEVKEDETEKHAILKRLRASSMPAMGKLQQFLAQVG